MSRWHTSDHHFYHANIIKHCARPFKTVSEMNRAMINEWNKHVGPEDDVIYYGDFMWSKYAGQKLTVFDAKDLLDRLNGKKILILGNHDNWLPLTKWRAAGFLAVYDSLRIEISGVPVNLSHYPYRGVADRHDRSFKDQLARSDDWLIHGHVHNNLDTGDVRERMFNVSCDAWGFKPVHESVIAHHIEQQSAWKRDPVEFSTSKNP